MKTNRPKSKSFSNIKHDEHIVEDITKFPFEDEQFDTVTFIANINHVPEPLRDIELTQA